MQTEDKREDKREGDKERRPPFMWGKELLHDLPKSPPAQQSPNEHSIPPSHYDVRLNPCYWGAGHLCAHTVAKGT